MGRTVPRSENDLAENDLAASRQALPEIKGGQLYGDKAYPDGPMKERLAQEQDLDVFTPVKKKKARTPLICRQALLGGGQPGAPAD